MKTFVQLSSALIALEFLIHSSAYSAGRETGNGGFAFSQSTPVKVLKFTSEELNERLSWRNETCVNQHLARKGLKPVELTQLRAIIKNVRKNYLSSATRLNSEGDVEPLLFNYGSDEKGPYIEAQQIYFISYLAQPYPDPRVQTSVANALLHEASHHFGYDEADARKFAETLRVMSNSTVLCVN